MATTKYDNRKTLPADLAARIATARRDAGSLRAVAERAGISHSFLCQITQGTRCPTRPVAERLIPVLGLDAETASELWDCAVDPVELQARYRRPRAD